MSNEYVDKQVSKIMSDKKLEFPLNMAMASAWILGNLKGVNLKVMNVTKNSSLCDFFVLASASNSTQMSSMANEISVQLKSHGAVLKSKEGLENGDWVLLDFGDILVHIFQETARQVYDLDNLWKDSTPVEIPNEYYYSEDTNSSDSSNSGRDFF